MSKKEMSASEQAKLAFVEFLQKTFFSQKGIAHFMGGSRRFGYNTEHSDFDLFVYIHKEDLAWLVESLTAIGMEVIDRKSNKYGSGIVLQIASYGLVHVSVFSSRVCFDQYVDEHKSVDELIQEEHNLVDVARAMRKRGISGAEVYRVLLDLAKEKK
jgi:hypothetical protein